MTLRAAELEVLYTANTTGVDQGEKKVKESAQRIESKPVVQKVDADTSEALAGMDRVESEAKKLVSERAVLQLDADITRTDKALDRARAKVEDLSIRAEAGFEVTAEVKRAEANLARLEQQAERLKSLRATVEVDASTVKAVAELDKLESAAKDAGSRAGDAGGSSLVSNLDSATRGAGEKVGAVVGGDVEESLISALTAIPIAGGIILAGVAIGKAVTGAIQDGLQQEVGFDRLEALTGIDPSSALRIGRAAGEAYANVFGDSVEANLNTARLALQFDIIDADTSTAQAKRVVEGLSGISGALEEDVRPTATAVTTLLKTGLAASAQEAFDLLAAGQRNGLNRSEDLLDTLTEYPVVLKRLGLSGEESLGLINQGLEAGARNSDIVADALKEFQIRATDASDLSAAGFERLGLNAEEMTAKIARGGADARDGLDEVLRKLRETEDPVQRNAAAVELFGTKAEDLGESLFALDLSSAVDQLGQVEGAAQRMFDTIADNDATKIEAAGRNIEVAMDGIKGALAAGFAEPLADVAEFVSENRGPVLEFFLGMANGALDAGESFVEAAASGSEAFGEFISGPAASLVASIAKVQDALGLDGSELGQLSRDMQDFDSVTNEAADRIRSNLGGSLADARAQLNDFGEGAVAMGYLNDASLRLAESLDVVGTNGEGARLSLEGVDLANLSASDSGAALERQLVNAAAALESELAAAERAGEGQEQLTERYNTTRDALISQIEQMGIGREAATQLVDAVLRTPASASTAFSSNAPEQQGLVQNLASRIETLPDGSVVIRADTRPANDAVEAMIEGLSNRRVTIAVGLGGAGGITRAYGGPIVGPGGPRDDVVPVMASNGEHMLPADEVQAAGGHDGVYRLRRMLKSGALRLADGGPVRAPADSTWRTVGPRADIVERVSSPSDAMVAAVAAAIGQVPAGRAAAGATVKVDAHFEQRDETLQARALGREIRNILSSSR